MKNITISVDEELAREIRIEAARAGMSMSKYLAETVRSAIETGPQAGDGRNPQFEAIERFLSGPPLHISVDGRMPSAEERNERGRRD
jgi:hypothetical protein